MYLVFKILCFIPLVNSFNSEIFSSNGDDTGHFKYVDAKFGTNYSFEVNSSIVFIFIFEVNETSLLPARITTESFEANQTYPVLVVVQQPKSVSSWQIPYIVGSEDSPIQEYPRTARTLCPAFHGNSMEIRKEQPIYIMVSCSSPESLIFSVSVDVTVFNIELDQPMTVSVLPSESQFFGFTFPPDVSSALLRLDSNSNICMSLSVQNFSCPVYDQEDDLKYKGYWETVTTKGGMLLTREAFPQRLFVIFVVHADDKDCTGHLSGADLIRNKTISFSVTRNITYQDYLFAVVAVVSVFSFTYLTALFLLIYCSRKSGGITFEDEASVRSIYSPDETDVAFTAKNNHSSNPSVNEACYIHDQGSSSGSTAFYREAVRQRILCVYDLSKEAHEVLRAKSNLYFWNLLTIAIFYSLPVIQLVFTYQKVLNQSGNQDLCYYNFLCSHRLGVISDFNHIFSNIGYILLGILFLLIVYRREKLEEMRDTGIPQHYGLYYTLGAALIMEGVLSACYHFCPNHSNFQFDTSFMYILAVISMLKIYQSRHPDINASAYLAFGILALLIFMGMCGVLYNKPIFYYIFTVIHVIVCLILSAQIYFMGHWKLDREVHKRASLALINPFRNREGNWWRPQYPSRMVLLILGNIFNWILIGVHLYSRLGDFATYLLAILMTNLLLYFIFYVLMKLFCGESILIQPLIYIILSLSCWAAAVYFFIHKSISWKLTPAESRTYNQPCVLWDFYDRHDIWHFLSATSMFFSFMVLLTLDDDLAHVDRRQISVF
ncbi:SID1 transmembrane family member 2-like [Lycorma delicatula]|uniref:SID1 transmembrane family member 2-like n=1 Tax=Lycorma delicatula TaxID=130591 RepID=UPI003F510548